MLSKFTFHLQELSVNGIMNELLPDIYLFNPTCEYSVANGNSNWQPTRILQKMEFDLSALPLFFAKKEDFVLVDRIPSPEFIESLKQMDIEIPNFILKSDATKNRDFIVLSKGKLLPWGWSPSVHKFLSPFKESCSVEFQQSTVFGWNKAQREIISRKFAVGILRQLQSTVNTDYLLPVEFEPKICTTKNDFETAIRQWGPVMIKAPWSSSGRGLQSIKKTHIHHKVWEKLMGIVNEQGYAIAEPYLNKVLDLALLFEITKGKIEFLGISYFSTNEKGQYEGNYLNGLSLTFEDKVKKFTDFVISEIRQPLINVIEASEMAKYYEGVFGVDMLIYADDENNLKINPCLEINVRYTMGFLALRIEKLIFKNKKGIFRIYFHPGITFYDFKIDMEKKYPLKLVENKIESGFIALTEAHEDSLFGAYILV